MGMSACGRPVPCRICSKPAGRPPEHHAAGHDDDHAAHVVWERAAAGWPHQRAPASSVCGALEVSPLNLQALPLDEAVFATQALLPPAVVLTRSQVWQRLAAGAGEVDVLEAEQRAIDMLAAALGAARRQRAGVAARRARITVHRAPAM